MTQPSGNEARSRFGEDLDAEVRAFVRAMGAAWASHPDLSTVTPAEARRIADDVREPWTRGGPSMAETVEHRIATDTGSVRVRCYDPGPPGPKPGLVYLHGGGWSIFSLDTHDRVMRELASRAGAVVVGVDYALSPEARYPVALGQVRDVLRFLRSNGGSLGVDPERLAVGGDSAGANLSVAACLSLRDAGEAPLPAGMLLVYGVFDRRSSPEAIARYGGDGYMLGASEMEQFWANYLRDGEDATAPLLSPARADLRHLPPTLLVIPELDLLAEQSLATAERLREAGVATEARLYRGACHSFLEAVSIAPLADRALGDIAEWLRSALSPGRSPEDSRTKRATYW